MHVPVLVKEVLEYLDAKHGTKFIDATVGGGGHTAAILKANKQAKILGIDRDGSSLEKLKIRFASKGLLKGCSLIHGNYADLETIATELKFIRVDGILIDLGFSSLQLDDAERGFSFQNPGPLDMRYDKNQSLTAFKVVNADTQTGLIKIFKEYGEEKFAHLIARSIVRERETKPIQTTFDLYAIIKHSLPGRLKHKAHESVRRIFQALRIEVNQELKNLEQFLPQAYNLLKKDGRIVVISFHSLEDRIVKQFFLKQARGCVCPPNFPVCVCGKASRFRILTRKPIIPSFKEINLNARSASAKLRAAQKI